MNKRAFNFFYGMGAAIVIVGVLFKLIHLGGALANLLLVVGMGVEAIIFAFSAFDAPEPEYDWTKVYPELADGKARPEKSVQAEQSTPAQKRYEDQLNLAATHMESLNALYNIQLEKGQAFTEALGSTAENAAHMKDAFGKLSGNLSTLNQVYGGMLSAMRIKDR